MLHGSITTNAKGENTQVILLTPPHPLNNPRSIILKHNDQRKHQAHARIPAFHKYSQSMLRPPTCHHHPVGKWQREKDDKDTHFRHSNRGTND